MVTLRQDLPFHASAPSRPPEVTHRGPVLPLAQEISAAVAVLITADPSGCQDLPFQWAITRLDLLSLPIAMQSVLDAQPSRVKVRMDAEAGSNRQYVPPLQPKETPAPGPTATQFPGPEHQTAFRCPLPAATAGALTVSGIKAAITATASTAATGPDLQPHTPDHHPMKSRPTSARTDPGR